MAFGTREWEESLSRLPHVEAAVKPWGDFDTPFDALGGEKEIRSIVDTFYDIVDVDAPKVRALLPKDDAISRDKLFEYLVEWTGGPALYSPQRGHPRMKMRHMPFAIGAAEVESWLWCFGKSLDQNDVTGAVRTFLDEKVTALAHHMQNQA